MRPTEADQCRAAVAQLKPNKSPKRINQPKRSHQQKNEWQHTIV